MSDFDFNNINDLKTEEKRLYEEYKAKLAEIKKDNVHVYNLELKEVYKEPEISLLDANGVQKNNYFIF